MLIMTTLYKRTLVTTLLLFTDSEQGTRQSIMLKTG